VPARPRAWTHRRACTSCLERRHRARARVEDRIRAAKKCGLENLPFRDFDANAVWLELVLIAQDLVFFAQTLALTGELARAEPKTLRYRLLHCAGRLAFHARRALLRLRRSWPWAAELAAPASPRYPRTNPPAPRATTTTRPTPGRQPGPQEVLTPPAGSQPRMRHPLKLSSTPPTRLKLAQVPSPPATPACCTIRARGGSWPGGPRRWLRGR
jgi:hypothetical protein